MMDELYESFDDIADEPKERAYRRPNFSVFLRSDRASCAVGATS